MIIPQKLSPLDLLNMQLVQAGLKPTSLVGIDLGYKLGFKVVNTQLGTQQILVLINAEVDGFKEGEKLLEEIVKNSEVKHAIANTSYYPQSHGQIGIGSVDSLKRLKNSKSENEIGLALGFPEDSVRGFSYGSYYGLDEQVMIFNGERAGKEVPPWWKYLSFVVFGMDLEKGIFPDNVKRIGETYREFTLKNFPELAAQIESKNASTATPVEYTMIGSRVMSITYTIPDNPSIRFSISMPN